MENYKSASVPMAGATDGTNHLSTTNPASANKYGTPEAGSSLYAATIGVEDLRRSVHFYTSAMGFDVVDAGRLVGAAFEQHWKLPSGVTAKFAALADRDCAVGRLVLVEFEVSGRQVVRNLSGQRFFGLVNLNFYTENIVSKICDLEALGCWPWSAPVEHDMGLTIGQPIEVMIDGPDSVIVNLIELRARNPEARIHRTIAYIADSGGFNRCGTTPVATSQHCVRDYDKAVRFNTLVLGMSIRNDTILAGAEMERFMRYPPGARTRDTYLQGSHVFGKIAINHPLNFDCVDITPRAVAPHIGYVAQSFIVPDIRLALDAAISLNSEIYSRPVEMDLPALGRTVAAIVRNPGSGALHELIQRS